MVASTTPRWLPLSRRFLALVLRPTAPPLWLGVIVAVGFIAVELLLVHLLRRVAPENAFGAIFLLGVLVVSAGWGFGLAVTTSLASAAVYAYVHAEGADSLVPALAVFLSLALLANVLAGQARLRALEAEQRRLEADLSAELARSTLRAQDPRAALTAAGDRIAEVLGLPFAELDLAELPGDDSRAAITLRDSGVVVGTLLVPSGLPAAARQRVERIVPSLEALLAATRDRQEITEQLEASHDELKASRARIVAASDQARRGFERDLHDGAQQRIVSLGLEMRALEASEEGATREVFSRAVASLMEVHADLQELSRGIHPAILSRGGLGPAIKTLARRSAVPVTLDVDVDRRLPESVEVAAYYVVAEALTNTAKHAQASEIRVCASVDDGELSLTISDDGVGGAVTGGGSGLIGLKDRVEAVSGRLDVSSPEGDGTTLTMTIPARVNNSSSGDVTTNR